MEGSRAGIPLSFFTIIIVLSCFFIIYCRSHSSIYCLQLICFSFSNRNWTVAEREAVWMIEERGKSLLPASFASLSDYWPRMLMRNEGVSHCTRLLKHTIMKKHAHMLALPTGSPYTAEILWKLGGSTVICHDSSSQYTAVQPNTYIYMICDFLLEFSKM